MAKKRVLLVEDAPDQRALIQMVFKDEGCYEVIEAETGTAALTSIEDAEFDLIMLDYMLPGCSGMDVLKRLREKGAKTPVLFMTALKNATLTIEAMRLGISDFILKEGAFQLLLPQVAKKILDKVELERALKEAEDKAAFQTQKLANLGKILSEILHELRNPISIIATGLESVRDAPDKEKALKLTLDLMLRNVERTRQTITSLLDFSRPKSYSFNPTDIVGVVREIMGHLKLKCQRESIELTYEGPDNLPEIPVDVQHLKGALLNLLMNAMEAMEFGGKLAVKLAATPEGKFQRLDISDSGHGIREEDRRHLFERNFTTKENGTGLGLIITNQIIRHHQGTIEVESVRGKGTTFSILLPLERRR